MFQGLKNLCHLIAAIFATVFFRYPARNLTVIGVTGTDGKTTTVNLIYEILKKAGKKMAMISSVGAKIGGKDYDLPFHVTTPSPWQLQKFLRMAVERGDTYLVLEVTSHGLDQNRVFGIPFKIGVLTNIAHEHLDYHQTFENYVKAKMKLFRGVEWAVINNNDNHYKNYKIKTITYGLKEGDFTPNNFPFTTSLPGDYNKLNCLAAISVGKALGISEKTICEGIGGFTGVEGRFESIDSGRGYQILIDFAHTPNAFLQLLKTIKPQISGRLLHVFGSAGLRDFTKRPLMGKIAAKYDDIIILTEEDYRTEDVNKIMEQIESGIDSGHIRQAQCKQARMTKRILKPLRQVQGKQVQDDTHPEIFKISDRQEAINKAIRMARKGDWVVLTGKGHEKSLCRGKTEFPWSEREAVKKALNKI